MLSGPWAVINKEFSYTFDMTADHGTDRRQHPDGVTADGGFVLP